MKMMFESALPRLQAKGIAAERITAAMENYTLPKLMASLLRGCNAETVEKKARAAEVNAAELAVEAEFRWPDARQALEAMSAKSPDPPSLQSLGAEKPMTQAQPGRATHVVECRVSILGITIMIWGSILYNST